MSVAAEEATEEATETKDEAEEQSPSRKVVRPLILVTYDTYVLYWLHSSAFISCQFSSFIM